LVLTVGTSVGFATTKIAWPWLLPFVRLLTQQSWTSQQVDNFQI